MEVLNLPYNTYNHLKIEVDDRSPVVRAGIACKMNKKYEGTNLILPWNAGGPSLMGAADQVGRERDPSIPGQESSTNEEAGGSPFPRPQKFKWANERRFGCDVTNPRNAGSYRPITWRGPPRGLYIGTRAELVSSTRSFKENSISTTTINDKNPKNYRPRGVVRRPDSIAVIGGRKYDFIRKSLFFFFNPDSYAVLDCIPNGKRKPRVVAIIRALSGPSRGIRVKSTLPWQVNEKGSV